MSAYDERLLDHALGELLGAGDRRDLTPDIVEAWRRGERGSLAPEEIALLLETELARPGETSRNGRPKLRPLAPVVLESDRAPRRRRKAAAAAAVLLVAVLAGFWAVGGGEDDASPVAGTEKPVAGAPTDVPRDPAPGEARPPDESPPSPDAFERFDGLFAALYLPGKGRTTWDTLSYADRLPQMRALSDLMAGRGPLWERFDGRVAELFETSSAALNERGWVLGTTLDFLYQDRSREALILARRLWLDEPEHFQAAHIVAFAEQGAFEFERECLDLLDLYDPALDPPPVHVAAYFAFRNEDLGRQILEETCAYPDPDGLDRCLLACLALERLGDDQVWGQVTARVRELVDSFLAEADLVMAREVVLLFEHYVRARQRGEDTVGGVTRGVFPHLAERRIEVQTERQIRSLLTVLTAG